MNNNGPLTKVHLLNISTITVRLWRLFLIFLHPQSIWLWLILIFIYYWIKLWKQRLLYESWHSFLCLLPPLSQMSDFVFLAICSHCAALPDRRHSGRLGSVNCKGMWHSFLKLRMFLWISGAEFCHFLSVKVFPGWHAIEHKNTNSKNFITIDCNRQLDANKVIISLLTH